MACISCALTTCPRFHYLYTRSRAKYTHRPGHRLSRVDNHIKGLQLLAILWLISYGYLAALPAARHIFANEFDDVIPASCATDGLISTRCAPLALTMALPPATVSIRASSLSPSRMYIRVTTGCSVLCHAPHRTPRARDLWRGDDRTSAIVSQARSYVVVGNGSGN